MASAYMREVHSYGQDRTRGVLTWDAADVDEGRHGAKQRFIERLCGRLYTSVVNRHSDTVQ